MSRSESRQLDSFGYVQQICRTDKTFFLITLSGTYTNLYKAYMIWMLDVAHVIYLKRIYKNTVDLFEMIYKDTVNPTVRMYLDTF